ncbi:hypothetical protein [Autumnicola musiva]|uniref:Uncharacterized protein n=1 Tax=Autumnicola musiva TaxID=3075589 RepID=A0ABU3D3E7_9FLAO|nr:hypothetical protein [Zunongwangia sp. F117]MDT0676060.1 hypothetical protein [Zunongwangia sp. F117]
MKKPIKIILLILLPLSILSCSNNDDNIEEEKIYYDLMINNETSDDIDIFLNTVSDTRGFVNNGSIAAGGEMLINDLEANVTYEIRAVNSGEPVENFLIEIPFENDNAEQQSILIER